MKAPILAAAGAALLLLRSTGAFAETPPRQAEAGVPDFTDVDPATLKIEPIPRRKDAKTGFLVGGVNPTARIKALSQLNGRPIAELEADMRPDADTEVGSTAGFLGKDERLLDVLALDNATVVDEAGLTHQELARHLLILAAIGDKVGEGEFTYHGRRYRVTLEQYRGYQDSPFRDGTRTNTDATVRNLGNNRTLKYSLLVPKMVARYGFYEGEGTPYRVDPRKVLEILDFLDAKKAP